MEELVRLAAKPIAFCGSAVLLIGLIYLGIQLKEGLNGGGEIRKALAMIAAGAIVLAFAGMYGFSGF